MKNIKAVVFDFDGTLAVLNIDFSEMRKQVFELMIKYGVDDEKIEEKYLLEIIDEVVQILNQKNPSSAETFYQEAHQILHEVELKAAREGMLLRGVEAALRSLRSRGLKVGIVTRNCEEAVRNVFPDIDQYCDVFLSRDSIKKVKPHPEQLTSVLTVLEVSGKEVMMVGDHPIDIQAGKRMAMMTVGVLTGRTTQEEFEKAGADLVLRDVPELCDLLAV
ncbi:MAG: HAD family hydrolase [Thermodesulfobacteriota bacterium]